MTTTATEERQLRAGLALPRRLRRLRRSPAIRGLVRETRVSPDSLVLPLFVQAGEGVRREVPSMPGVCQLSVDEAVNEATAARDDGVRAVLLFGLPGAKDAEGSAAADPEAPVQRAIRALKQAAPDVLVITDVCLCEYTSHGHCGIVAGDEIVNDPTVEHLARAAVSHAEAGADVVAPSDMMDGRVGAIRDALDDAGFEQVAIMAYAAKYCSAYYGPFRDAADSTPAFGDRRTHQMDPANVEEALREVALDIEEGADVVMVKPALHYLDVISRGEAGVRLPDRCLPRQRRVRDAQGGGAERLDRRGAGDDGGADGDRARRRGHPDHLLRPRRRPRPGTLNASVRRSAPCGSRRDAPSPPGASRRRFAVSRW